MCLEWKTPKASDWTEMHAIASLLKLAKCLFAFPYPSQASNVNTYYIIQNVEGSLEPTPKETIITFNAEIQPDKPQRIYSWPETGTGTRIMILSY